MPIEKQVFEGQTLMVQVIKDPIGTKGARLSTQISIAGRLLVFLPQDDHIGISQKIAHDRARRAARSACSALVPRGRDGGGFILRTNGRGRERRRAGRRHRLPAQDLGARSASAPRTSPPPALLHQDLSLLQRVLRDLVDRGHADASASTRASSSTMLQEFGREFMPSARRAAAALQGRAADLRPVQHRRGDRARRWARRVDLKSGGYLIVDQTEALTTVDVNTGGFVGARNFDDTIFKTNLEAAQAIARQLRLRNLGGIIIVDFIDMAREDHRDAVLAEFRKQLARDRIKTMAVSGFSQLGLVEMTRKRTRESLAHMLCEPCPACQGQGSVKTARTRLLRHPARDPARGAPVQPARVPHPRRRSR